MHKKWLFDQILSLITRFIITYTTFQEHIRIRCSDIHTYTTLSQTSVTIVTAQLIGISSFFSGVGWGPGGGIKALTVGCHRAMERETGNSGQKRQSPGWSK